MNCETIASILDDHRAARLGAAERRDVDAHLHGCDRCAETWSTHHLLASERFDAPPAGLFERLTTGLDTRAAPPARATGTRRRWVSPALAASLLLVMAATIWRLPDPQREATASAPVVTGPVLSTLTAPVDAPPPAAAALTAGVDYDLVGRGSLPAMSGGRAQVVEFFAWWCNPCYAFDAQLERWKQSVEPRIEVVRIPVVWNQRGELHARAYYTAAVLGRLDVMHGPVFAEIHDRGNPLSSPEAWAKLFAAYGVDPGTFDATFNSTRVDAQVERAAALASEYGITSTPSLVVGGRYLVNATRAGSTERLFAVAEQLAAGGGCSVRNPASVQERGDPIFEQVQVDRDAARAQEALNALRERTQDPSAAQAQENLAELRERTVTPPCR